MSAIRKIVQIAALMLFTSVAWGQLSLGGGTNPGSGISPETPYISIFGTLYDSNYAPSTPALCSTVPNVNAGASGAYFCFDSTSTPATAGNVLYRSNIWNQNGPVSSNTAQEFLFLTPWSSQTGFQANFQYSGIATNDGPHVLMAACDTVNHVILLFGSYTPGGTANTITVAGIWASNTGSVTECAANYPLQYFIDNSPINSIAFNSEGFDISNMRLRMKYIPGPVPTWNMEYNQDGSGLTTDGNGSGWVVFGNVCPVAACSFNQTVGQPSSVGYDFLVGSEPCTGSGSSTLCYQGPQQLSVKSYQNENHPFPYFTSTDCYHASSSNPLSSVSCSFTVPSGLNNAAAIITTLFATNNTTVTLSASVSGVSSTLSVAAAPQLPVTGQGYTTQQFVVTGLSSGSATVTVNCSGSGCGTAPGGAQLYAELWGNVNTTSPLNGTGVSSQPSVQAPIPCPSFTYTNPNASLIAAPTWNNTASPSNATNPPMTVQNSTNFEPIYWAYPSTVGSYANPFVPTVNVQIPWESVSPTVNTCAVFAVQP